jgi:hypothetical protein
VPGADRGEQRSGIARWSDQAKEGFDVGEGDAAIDPAGNVTAVEMRGM